MVYRLSIVIILLNFIIISSNNVSASSTEEENSNLSSSSSSSLYLEEDITLNNKLKFLNIGEGQQGNIFIYCLKPKSWLAQDQHPEGTYEAMLEQMSNEVSSFVSNGWKNHMSNKYKGFTFAQCTFDKALIEDVANILKVYKNSLNPKTHFYECVFLKQKLRNHLRKAAEFKLKSTFLRSREKNNSGKEFNIPDTK